MRVAFLYNRSCEDPAHAAEDENPDKSPVVDSLQRLGHTVVPIACTLDLAAVREQVVHTEPDIVFNRVESLGGSDSMMAAVTLLLDSMDVPYTGNSTAALIGTASKTSVKQRLVVASMPTPAWIDLENCSHPNPKSEIGSAKFILKSVHEHASFEIDDSSVVRITSARHIETLLRDRETATGRDYFAEEFIEGREFNLSLLGSEPQVLPPAEIDFSALPDGREHVVGYNAKCDADSFEYNHTDRRFEFAASDATLLRRLGKLAAECWHLFDLCGYARVDFRVDAAGEPWILEVNTNPCILPDAGFSAALAFAGICYDDGIQRILDEAIARCHATLAPRDHGAIFNK